MYDSSRSNLIHQQEPWLAFVKHYQFQTEQQRFCTIKNIKKNFKMFLIKYINKSFTVGALILFHGPNTVFLSNITTFESNTATSKRFQK